MKIIAILGDGSNQRGLAQRLHKTMPIAHIAKIKLVNKKKRKIFKTIVSRTLAYGIYKSWSNMMKYYDNEFPDWPLTSTSTHSTANAEELITIIENQNPDLILVSGTDLITKTNIERFSTKIMNLHTGISPYIKGGPNCTNWALSIGEFDLIGNTVMWIDSGIDTGSIISTERTQLSGYETLTEIHIKVMDHAHDLYCRAVRYFIENKKISSTPQNLIGEGRLFYNRDWNSLAMIKATFNYHMLYRPFENRADLQLITLKEVFQTEKI